MINKNTRSFLDFAKADTTISLGRNPVSGGSPPNENRRRLSINPIDSDRAFRLGIWDEVDTSPISSRRNSGVIKMT